MIIVGIHNSEDSGVCLIEGGKLLDAASEERFNRVKLYDGFPEQSLMYLLEKHKLQIGDVDLFCYAWYTKAQDYPAYIEKLLKRSLDVVAAKPDLKDVLYERVQIELEKDDHFRQLFIDKMAELGAKPEQIRFVEHHEAHAWSAFSFSPFDKALVFTLDGRGDGKSGSVYYADGQGLKEMDFNLTYDSVGFLYGQITKYLGYKPHRHEGKITGLAGFGSPEKTQKLMAEFIDFNGEAIQSDLNIFNPYYDPGPAVENIFKGFSKEDVAAGLQKHTEDMVCRWAEHWIKRILKEKGVSSIPVCLAGGVFANVAVNRRVAEIDGVQNIFVFPAMGDGGLTSGAAARAIFDQTGKTKITLQNVYLGPSYSEEQIAEALQSHHNQIDFEKPENIAETAVQDIQDNKVIGLFSGAMEYGPRALGGRSIIYHTNDKSVNEWLNKRMARTEFMPFAPVTPEEYAQDCYIGWAQDHVAARYMTRTYACTDEFQERHPAVVHVDGTARPQVITREGNPLYYDIVKTYCEKTGDKALINTSFNRHEEPIVNKPEEAISGLLDGMIDVLIAGPYRATLKKAA